MKPIFSCIFLFLISILSAQNRFYVNASATGADNGQTWFDAFKNLQAALKIAENGDTVWVSKGTYLPTNGSNRDSSFYLKSGVRLYGGFIGNEVELAERDWQTQTTVLSADINTPDDSTDNSYTILYMENPDSTTLIDGFVLRFGNAASLDPSDQASSPRRSGGAMYIMAAGGEAYPLIRNCRFEQNYALKFGGAVYINGTNSGSVAPMFLNCVFESNKAGLDGGAVYRNGSSFIERSPDFGGCTFNFNSSNRWAGGIYYEDTEANDIFQIWNSDFIGNRAFTLGGGAYLSIGRDNGSKIDIKDCDFTLNYGTLGSALCVTNLASFSNTEFINVTNSKFNNNSVGGSGAVLYAESFGITNSSNILLDRDTFLQNTSNTSTNVVFAAMSLDGTVTLSNSLISENNISYLLNLSSPSKLKIENTSITKNTSSFGLLSLIKNNNVEMNNVIISKNDITSSIGYPIQISETNLNIRNCIIESSKLFYQEVTPGVPVQSSINISNSALFVQDFITYESNMIQTATQIDHSLLDGINLSCTNLPPGVVCGPNNLIGLDPMFQDTAIGDYSLLPCSPLIDAGSNVASTDILTDIAGNPRILGGTVDIGAYESRAFALTVPPQIQPTCAGTSEGSIAVNPGYGCEPYHYNWSPPAGNGPELNGLPPGDYIVTITDGIGRQILDTLQVPFAPSPILNLVATDAQCGITLGGAISAGVSNGTAPYHYQWQPSASDTSQLKYLSPGTYALTVVDAKGCQDSASANIALLGMLTLMVDGQGISCHGATDGWLSATPVTGASPFSWLWQGWSGTDSIAQPLSPGIYAVTVSDAFGCTASFAFPPMNQPDSLWATVGTQAQTNLNMPNGAAVVTTISGGTSPFGFDWNTGSTQQAITGLMAGNYTVTVTDKNGCEAVVEVVVDSMFVGTEEAVGMALMIYPNPAVDWVKIILPARQGLTGGPEFLGENLLELSDASGRVLQSEAFSSANGQLSLGGLPSGNYVVTVRNGTGKGMFVGKLTKI